MTPEPSKSFVAPARVNLIGEHTDYSGGLVLPMAIPFYTTATLATAADAGYLFESELFPSRRTLSLSDRSDAADDWSDYPVGVLRQLQQLGYQPGPMRLRLGGNIPLGSGLSSSASVEVATAYALLSHLGAELPPEQIALLCQRAENEYVGSPCGIMDQSVIVMAQKDHALLLNTRTLEHEAVPTNRGSMAELAVVVVNSMVKHSIASGEYGDRRRDVEAGQAAVVAHFPALRDLGDATMQELEAARGAMSDESFLRCRHIITENARVRAMREAMLAGNAHDAGQLMLASHASQRDDFQCSVPEVDFLVETAAALPGCYGARLTGGGFGGCTVNLVRSENTPQFMTQLKEAYMAHYSIGPDTFICTAVDGAMRLNRQGAKAS